ncbi:MAG: alanine racemase [Ilumatobacteraceae bacterium]|nr:alanine racemase [Ilumatobacteraceae bacterium]
MTDEDDPVGRWAWAEIEPDAIEHNVRVIRAAVAPSDVWAVVKADGYGHGAVVVAEAALRGGAAGLCVALVIEGVRLRAAGLDAPILVLSEQPVSQIDEMLANGLTPTVYTPEFVRALAARSADVGVHVNIDTGMQRVGVRAGDVTGLVDALASSDLSVEGVFTHLACADEPRADSNRLQLDRFDAALAELRRAGIEPRHVHAANSAAALALPDTRRSFVRSGIAIYGVSPGAGVDHLCGELRPAMTLAARVSFVKRVDAGSSISYGWRHRFERSTTVATVPIGYADGVPRRLGTLPDRPGAEVLIGGRRHLIVGVVTMDQFMVDVGDTEVRVGDEAVLIGAQGDDRIRAEDWADRLGTIGYEVVCGIGVRVPRVVRTRREPS